MMHSSPSDLRVPSLPVVRFDEPSESVALRLAIRSLSVAIVVGVHVGLYLIATRTQTLELPPIDEASNALMIDLSAPPSVVRSEVENVTNGPQSVAQEEIKEVKQVEEPPPVPAVPPMIDELVAPPAAIVSEVMLPPPQEKPPEVKPPEEKPPEEKPPEVKPQEVKPPEVKPPEVRKEKPPEKPRDKKVSKKKDEPHPAQKATINSGTPRSDVQTGTASVAPSTGGIAPSDSSKTSWMNGVRSQVARAKRYPPEAREQNMKGIPVVAVTIGSHGELISAHLVSPSGFKPLDDEAVASMKRAAPYSPPPGGITATIRIPLNFDRR